MSVHMHYTDLSDHCILPPPGCSFDLVPVTPGTIIPNPTPKTFQEYVNNTERAITNVSTDPVAPARTGTASMHEVAACQEGYQGYQGVLCCPV
jgi:hypothetical protein